MIRVLLFMSAMERRFVKVSFILLPFVLYTAVMLRMIDNTCQTDIFKKQPIPHGVLQRTSSVGSYSNKSLQDLLKQYEYVEKQRAQVLGELDAVLSRGSHGTLDAHDSTVKFLNTGNIRRLKGFDKIKTNSAASFTKPRYVFNCTNTHAIKLVKKIGHGVSKQAFLGKYKDKFVAVKMVTRHQKEVRICMEDLRGKHTDHSETLRSRCFVFPTMKLMKEILLLEQLDHPGFVDLLGYCVRSEESDSTDMAEHGVVAIYEYGERFILENLQYLPIDSKLQHALRLSEFLLYLEHSPLGSLRVKDFKEGHFLMVNKSLKMIDLDDVDNIEPSCDIYSEMSPMTLDLSTDVQYRTCEHDIQCQMGLCIGYNAKENLKSMNRLFFKRLLYPISYPSHLTEAVSQVNARLDTLTITVEELIEFLQLALSHLR